jgi:hypothetical protein
VVGVWSNSDHSPDGGRWLRGRVIRCSGYPTGGAGAGTLRAEPAWVSTGLHPALAVNGPACCGMLRVDQHGPRGSRAGGPRKWLRIAVRSSDEVRASMEGTRQSMEQCWMDCWAPVSEECPVMDDPDLCGPGWERCSLRVLASPEVCRA